MPKVKISEFDTVAANNTDIDGINLGEGMLPSDVNNAMRELMAQLKDFQAGTVGDSFNGPHNGTVGASTPAAGTFTSLSDSGNLTFTGTGNRITGDFSNATLSNRVAFQTSTTNAVTFVGVLPNGTGSAGILTAWGTSDPNNSPYIAIRAQSTTEGRIDVGFTGTASAVPLTMYTGGSERLRIDTSGNVGIGTSSPGNRLSLPNNNYIGWKNSTNTGETAGIIVNSSNNLVLYNGADRLTVDSSGNVILNTGMLREKQTAVAASDINLNLGNFFTRTISGTTTLTVSNIPTSGTTASFILDLTNGGSATVNWWSNVKWAGGTAPTLTSAGRDSLGFYTHDGGTTWTGLLLGRDIK